MISSAFPVSAVVDSCMESLWNNSAASESSDFANTDTTDNLVFGDDNTPLVAPAEDNISTADAAVIHPIYTAQGLQNINQDFSGSYYLANDIDLAESDCLPDAPNNNFVSIRTEDSPLQKLLMTVIIWRKICRLALILTILDSLSMLEPEAV